MAIGMRCVPSRLYIFRDILVHTRVMLACYVECACLWPFGFGAYLRVVYSGHAAAPGGTSSDKKLGMHFVALFLRT